VSAPRLLREARIRVATAPVVPWWGQRAAGVLEAAGNLMIMGVAGRQSGKSHWGCWRVLRRAARMPGAESCLLVPTYRIALAPAARLRELGQPLGGEWREQKQCLRLPNGHLIWVRSTDRPDATRGLTIKGTLWCDEAALISENAWTAALGCLVAAEDPLVLITTTPAGRNNWVYRLWIDLERESVARFLFRSKDSPYAGPVLGHLRGTMGGARAAQELDAMFVDDKSTPFPPDVVDKMFTTGTRPLRHRGEQRTLGVDLAKEQDFTVATLMNEFGEAWVVGRWQHVKWPDTESRIAQLARDHDALVVIDIGHGGGYGGALFDYLERSLGVGRVLGVRTGNVGVKGEIFEALSGEAQHGRVQVDSHGPFAADLRHELLFLTSTRKVVAGVERVIYEGPTGEDEHDDCAVSLALANWGRLHGWEPDPLKGDFGGFGGDPTEGGGPLPDGGDLGGFGSVGGTGYSM
jgi:hypothetical protein